MIPASVEKPVPSAAIPSNAPNVTVSRSTGTPAKTKTVLVGFDFGTNKSCVLAGAPGSTDIGVSKVVPTVVGYVKDGIVDGIVAGNRSILFGDDALQNMLHVRLVAPLADG
ncbi:MAG: hypothetical protein ABIV50_12560, partial [Opitutus sp.]